MRRVKPVCIAIPLLACVYAMAGARNTLQQTVTLYPPKNQATGKYDESRACFSFKHGANKQPNSIDWDLAYGFLRIGNADWFTVSSKEGARSVIKDLGKLAWSDSFNVPVLEPLPELKAGEKRVITIDTSGGTHRAWAKSINIYAKAEVGHIYVMHVKDLDADFYVLFRLEELEQRHHCTISWRVVPTPL